ncbi:MAG: hypothetical protein R3308_10110, partial [Thiohalobacterales bacterium]|nr:hypothetical protein [Thiohalobacterales bacterium]
SASRRSNLLQAPGHLHVAILLCAGGQVSGMSVIGRVHAQSFARNLGEITPCGQAGRMVAL